MRKLVRSGACAEEGSGDPFHLLSGSYAGSEGREESVGMHLPEGAQQEIILKNSGNLFCAFCLSLYLQQKW